MRAFSGRSDARVAFRYAECDEGDECRVWPRLRQGDTGEGVSVTRRLPVQVLVQLRCVGPGLLGCGKRVIGAARSRSLFEASVEGSLGHLLNDAEAYLFMRTFLCASARRKGRVYCQFMYLLLKGRCLCYMLCFASPLAKICEACEIRSLFV